MTEFMNNNKSEISWKCSFVWRSAIDNNNIMGPDHETWGARFHPLSQNNICQSVHVYSWADRTRALQPLVRGRSVPWKSFPCFLSQGRGSLVLCAAASVCVPGVRPCCLSFLSSSLRTAPSLRASDPAELSLSSPPIRREEKERKRAKGVKLERVKESELSWSTRIRGWIALQLPKKTRPIPQRGCHLTIPPIHLLNLPANGKAILPVPTVGRPPFSSDKLYF